jgi:glycosyltransferase involved in cell wall biosynthesis
MEYVLGDVGILADLGKPGALAAAVSETLERPCDARIMAFRREDVRRRFSWEALGPQYAEMFRRCAGIN